MAIYQVTADSDAEVTDVPIVADTLAELLTVVPPTPLQQRVAIALDFGLYDFQPASLAEADGEWVARPNSISSASPGRYIMRSASINSMMGAILPMIQSRDDDLEDLFSKVSVLASRVEDIAGKIFNHTHSGVTTGGGTSGNINNVTGGAIGVLTTTAVDPTEFSYLSEA